MQPMKMHLNLPFQARDVIESVQEEKFSEMVDLCFERHPYYRALFKKIGLKRTDIQSLTDIHKIPVIDKQIYAQRPEAFRLDTTDLPIEMTVDWDVMHTTGTSSGKPTPFYSTTYDFYSILTSNRRALEIRGVKTTDIVANLCPMTLHPYGAYHRTIAAANAMKIPVISPLPGRPSGYFHWSAGINEVVSCIERSRATILWGVCSYVRRVIQQAQAMQADFSSVRFAFVTGESVSEAMRGDMALRLSSLGSVRPQINVSYAATEMQVGTVECQPGSGYHNPAPDEFYFEVLDPETHVPLAPGERGMAALTHLNRRGTVLLRYLMGDLTVQSTDACPHCGTNTDRFVEMPTRADNLVKIKGMLINPAVVESVLLEEPAIADFQILIEPDNPEDPLSMDKFTLRLATADDKLLSLDKNFVAEKIRTAIGLRPLIDVVSPEEIFDPESSLKSKRIVDLRGS